jgi:hypothetical protein
MTRVKEYEPPGWRDLCAKLQRAKDPEEFQTIVNEINELLSAHEKSHPDAFEGKPRKPVSKKGARAKAV